MDLEKFLEKDIIEFLEKKDIERKQKSVVISEELEEFSTDKDYMTLFKSALQNKDIIRAKGLFLEVQNKFANSKKEVEKEAYTGLIETMFTEMQSLDQNKETDKAFIEELSDMKIIEDKILSDGDRFKKDFNDNKEKIKSAILELGESIYEDLQKNDLLSAINKYKILKQKFAQFPDELKEEKESLFNDLITYYYQIRKLEKIKIHDTREARIERSELKKEVLTSVKEESLILFINS